MLQNNSKPVFLVDAMLGNIAKKLRLLGFDSEYSSDIKDEELVLRAKKEDRILLTKDLPLLKNAKKQSIQAFWVEGKLEMDQLVQIFKKFNVRKISISGNTSRCTECNGTLESVQKDKIKDEIPAGVLKQNNEFWQCIQCKKIYWEGTHIERLQKFVRELNEKL